MRKNQFDILCGQKPELYTCTEAPPPFSFVGITSAAITNKQFIRTVVKPDTTFRQSYGVTGPYNVTVTSGAADGVMHSKGYAIVKYGDSSVAIGDSIGPKPDSWEGWKGYYGGIVELVLDATSKLALVKLVEVMSLVGKAGSNIAALATATPGSGNVTIWVFDGTVFSSTSFSPITGYNLSSSVVTATKFLQLKKLGNIWLIDFEGCS